MESIESRLILRIIEVELRSGSDGTCPQGQEVPLRGINVAVKTRRMTPEHLGSIVAGELKSVEIGHIGFFLRKLPVGWANSRKAMAIVTHLPAWTERSGRTWLFGWEAAWPAQANCSCVESIFTPFNTIKTPPTNHRNLLSHRW
jgi:hypothetical protein